MKKESVQYQLCREALKDVTTDKTVVTYKRSIKQFVAWEREHPPAHALDPAERVQRWERALEKQGYSPASIHSKIAPVCKGFKVSMSEISHPRRTSDKITRGRRDDANRQGQLETENKLYADSLSLSRGTGLRRAELSRVRLSDLVKDESGYPCIRTKGKGGKVQYQRILPSHLDDVRAVLRRGAVEMGGHIDYHSIRSSVAREAYSYYKERLDTEPGYRAQLRKELVDRFNAQHGPGRAARERYMRSMGGNPYVLRGANAQRARQEGRPTVYDRTALLAVSVFHLSHWRVDVTVTNYLV